MIDETILTRIANLLRMAEHPNSNEHEASLAMEKAQALLLEHNLSRASINTATGPAPEPSDNMGSVQIVNDTGHDWKTHLLGTIAKYNLCKVINDKEAHTAHLFGAQGNVLAVVQMYEWILEQLETIGMREWTAYKRSGGTETARTWKAAFHDGARAALRDRLEKPLEAFQAGSGRAIVLRNETRLAAAVKAVFPYTSQSRSTIHYGSDGYSTGKQAGNSLNLGRSPALSGGRLALGSGR